jgi:hypothetical protein
MAHKLQGDWKSTILAVSVVNGTVTEEDDGNINIEDIDDHGNINKCSHRGGASGALVLHGKADDNTATNPVVELHQEDATGGKINPRYVGKLKFEIKDNQGKTTQIIVGAVFHTRGSRRTTQQEDTWVATKQG